jgi:hypothetical protein
MPFIKHFIPLITSKVLQNAFEQRLSYYMVADGVYLHLTN